MRFCQSTHSLLVGENVESVEGLSPPPPPEKQGSEEMPQSENAENADKLNADDWL